MDLRTLCPFQGAAINQYTPPRCFELAGEKFELIMDDGYDYFLSFIDGSALEWNWAGDEPKQADYICLKGDDTTYLVSFELKGASPRINHTFVLDRENNLVTRLISKIGTNPKFPYLMKTEYEFGVIHQEGVEVKLYPRHGFSQDVTGTVVQWVYGAEMCTVHAYYCNDFYRISYPRDPAFSAGAQRMIERFNNMVDRLPNSAEPSTYIKIKEGLYLFTLTEAYSEKLRGTTNEFRSNTMSFIHNFKTMRTFGRSFGTSTPPDKEEVKTHILYHAYGKLIDPEGDEGLMEMLNAPNPYIIGG
ncbi:MAG: molybdenum cofactor biosynthesis F family protein [Peptococcaceae bacterium]|jgi:hypothetical protein|nr:molybdenum cofactor biosynthesis F family protein [Peptococcaceae bacterium]